jgi:hypothetical protein
MKKFDYEIVYVRWIDSGYSLLADRWQDIEDVKNLKDEIKPIETVGFLLEESADYLILAQSYSCSENSVRGGYIIYKKNILERRTCR